MSENDDLFERRFEIAFRAYLAASLAGTDARRMAEAALAWSAPRRSPIRILTAGAAGLVGVVIIGALVLSRLPPSFATATPSAQASFESSPGGSPSAPAPTSVSTPSPSAVTAGMSERERSDWFWGQVTHFGHYGFNYESLREITDDAHLIVRGRVTGRLVGELELFNGDVARVHWGVVTVDAVLKGTPQEKTPGTILVEGLGEAEVPVDNPSGEVILFLKNYARLRTESGSPPSADPNDRFYYGRPNGYQCVLRNLDGQIRVPTPFNWNGDLGPFLTRIEGQPYDQVVSRIRALVADST